MKQEVSSIFCLKSLAAFLVLVIHFHFYGLRYLAPITMSAVSIFFVIGGYFLYDDDHEKLIRRERKQIKKLIKILLVTNGIYFVLEFLVNEKLCISSLTDFFHWILMGDNISGHLWFLNAYIYGLIVILLFDKCVRALMKMCRISDKGGSFFLLLLLSACVWLYGLFERQYSFVIPLISLPDITKVDLTVSLPMIVAGMAIRKFKVELTKRNALLVFFLCVVIAYSENRLIYYCGQTENGNCVGRSIIAISLLLLAISNKSFGKNSMIAYIGKEHSANIYYWQYLPVIFIGTWLYHGVWNEISLAIILPLTLMISWSINKLETLYK